MKRNAKEFIKWIGEIPETNCYESCADCAFNTNGIYGCWGCIANIAMDMIHNLRREDETK